MSTSVAKRRRILFEWLMCFGLPTVYAALRACLLQIPSSLFIHEPLIDLIVQPRRFDVYANFGCRPATYPSLVALFLVWIPPLALSFATLIFCCKTMDVPVFAFLTMPNFYRHHLASFSSSRGSIFEDTRTFVPHFWRIHSACQHGCL